MNKNIEPKYAYNFAEIDPSLGNMCVGMHTTTDDQTSEFMIPVPVYDENYIFKYYLNGSWWVDAEGTIPWKSALLP